MQESAKSSNPGLWMSLSETQWQEVITAYDESLDKKNLVSNEVVMGKHKRWLSEIKWTKTSR